MKNREDNLKTIRGLFLSQSLAVLSTQKDGHPYASLVAFSFSKDLKQIFFLTPAFTRKYKNLSVCPEVAMLINSACNRPDDFFNAISVTATGKARTLVEKEERLKEYLERHPQLAEFSKDPSTAMICVDVDDYILVNRFQNTVRLRMDQ
jgi:general stress protein 26